MKMIYIYINPLEKFKTKTRNLEHKIVKLNKAMDKQNENIIDLKLENKMLKNVFVDKNNNDFDDGNAGKTMVEMDTHGNYLFDVFIAKWENISIHRIVIKLMLLYIFI